MGERVYEKGVVGVVGVVGMGLDYLERFGGGVERTLCFGYDMMGIWISGSGVVYFVSLADPYSSHSRGKSAGCFGKPRRASDLFGLTPDS